MIRFCLWLLERYLPPQMRAAVIGDLIEGEDRGRLWFARETVSALWHFGARPRGGGGLLSSILRDLQVAARLLARSPGFAIVSIVTLGLAIGATTTVFSIIDPILLRPLPYPDPGRLVFVWERDQDGSRDNIGFTTYRDLVAQSGTIQTAAAIGSWTTTLSGPGDPERLDGDRVSATYFRTLGVRPAMGRDFRDDEDAPGHNQVVILSDGLWRRRFGGDSAIVGKPILLDGGPMTVVGVMPASFDNVVSPGAQIWRVLGYSVTQPWACRTCHHLRMLARIRPSVTTAAGGAELDRIFARIVKAYPTQYASVGANAVPLQDEATRDYRAGLVALAAAVFFVLLIAAANVVNLQLARAVRRDEEFAIRTALGAGYSRLVRQLLTESFLLAALGGLAGVLVAAVALRFLVAQLPVGIPRVSAIHLDLPALAATAAIVLALAVTMGLAPARGRVHDLGETLRSGRRLAGGHHRTRAALVVAEVGLSVMLLLSAGLVARSLVRLFAVNVGFEPSHVLTLEFSATGPQYASNEQVYAEHDRVRDAVRAIPGVTSVAVSNQVPLAGNVDMYGVIDPANVPANPELVPSGDRYVVSTDFFRTMRVPILAGRAFTERDAADTANKVALVSAALAQRLWPGQPAIGKLIQLGGLTAAKRTIIGVAGNVHHHGLDAAETLQWYVPEGQWTFADNTEALVVRTERDPATLAAAVRRAVRAIDPTQPIVRVETMERVVAASAAQRRLALVLFAAFAAAALLLSIAGIYGVLSGSVAERTREIGIRGALGATPRDIVSLVVTQGGRLAALGLALGLAGSFALTRLLRTLLFGVGPHDPATVAAVVVVLGAVTLLACLIPAARAARVNPSRALRAE